MYSVGHMTYIHTYTIMVADLPHRPPGVQMKKQNWMALTAPMWLQTRKNGSSCDQRVELRVPQKDENLVSSTGTVSFPSSGDS